MVETVSKAEFARRHGWDRSYVTRLVQQNRLVLDGTGPRARIKVAESEAALAARGVQRVDMARFWEFRRAKNLTVSWCLKVCAHEVMVSSRREMTADQLAARQKFEELVAADRHARRIDAEQQRKASPQHRQSRALEFRRAYQERRDWTIRNRLRLRRADGLDHLIPLARELYETRDASRQLKKGLKNETI